ncbi:hypothetical protein BC829DRAFT_39589 [Chytridium lagenaria]|nr:hypothetical protein BC829DRAFT_39589 [Chytridium lagenaria]
MGRGRTGRRAHVRRRGRTCRRRGCGEQDDFVVQDDAVDGAKKKKRAAVLVPIIIFPWTQESARDMFKEYDRCWFKKLFIDPFQTMNPEPVNDKVNGVFKTQEDFATFLMTIDTATGPKAKILEMAKERLPYLSKSAIELQLKEVAVREAIGVEKKKWRIKDDYSSHLPSLLSKKRKTPFTVNSE